MIMNLPTDEVKMNPSNKKNMVEVKPTTWSTNLRLYNNNPIKRRQILHKCKIKVLKNNGLQDTK